MPTLVNATTGDVQIKQLVNSGPIYYSVNGNAFTEITTYPISIQNTSGQNRNVKFITNIYINNPSVQFETISPYITFDGLQIDNSRCMISFDNVNSYTGFFKSITSSNTNVIVQNFNTQNQGNPSTLNDFEGWLCSQSFGLNCTNVIIQNCTNNCRIIGNEEGDNYNENLGGICGSYVGHTGSVQIINCSNNGEVSTPYSGGIVSSFAGKNFGLVKITNCSNTGNVSGGSAGGICGNNCSAQILKCWNTGIISGDYSGGIAGNGFGYNTNRDPYMVNCYNIGNISGTQSGGMTSNNIGFCNDTDMITNNTSTTVDITNCYNRGSIGSGCGGICGFADVNNDNPKRQINVYSCYSSGSMTDANSGIFGATSVIGSNGVPISLQFVYVTNNNWSDDDANYELMDTDVPLSLNNQADAWTNGIAWIKLAGENVPYVLSAFYSEIYNLPTNTINNTSYTSPQGLFQPGFTYTINNTSVLNGATVSITPNTGVFTINNMVPSNTYTIDIFVAKYDDNGRPYSYNYDTYSINTATIEEEQPPQEPQPTIQPPIQQAVAENQNRQQLPPHLIRKLSKIHTKVKGYGIARGIGSSFKPR